ncbi:MAG: hypothetical protein P8I03_11600 [Thalassotalea sp.]|nr:hypothetical protein [Thalassotalea sp.]
MDNKQKAKSSKEERKAQKLADNAKIKKYKISQIAIKQNVTPEEAEVIYNTRAQKQQAIGKRKKRKGVNKKNKFWGDTHSVYTSLDGVTGARTWNKVK